MKRLFYTLAVSAALAACNPPSAQQQTSESTEATAAGQAGTADVEIKGKAIDLQVGDVHFTKAVNGADSLISVDPSTQEIAFRVGEKKDYFLDPDGKLSNNTAPILLSAVDNTKPFTLFAKVKPTFTETGLYNAGVLFLYAHEELYQKFCFEQDEHGVHRVVSVRTDGSSDDNNHEPIEGPEVYMKISSDGKTVASYYSADNKNWKLARLYQNQYPDTLWVGISSQCPVDTGSVAYFADLKLEENSVADFRLGN